jgi:hypothetical protein
MSLLCEINHKEVSQSLNIKIQIKELYKSVSDVTEIVKHQFSEVLGC